MRADGKRVKADDPIHDLVPYFMYRRCDSQVFITLNFPLKPIRAYIVEKRKAGTPVSHMAILIAACVRTIRDYPEFNRFIMNSKLYDHNDLTISLLIMRPGADDSIMSKILFDLNDDIFTVHRKVEAYIDENRGPQEPTDTDKAIRTLMSMPVILNGIMALIRFLDRRGWLPKALIDVSPFHASLGISNLASLKTPSVFHHLYEMGTTSCFIVIGKEQIVPVEKDGVLVPVRTMPIGMTLDERVCSGAYYAKCLDRLRHYMEHPAEMEGE
jgi:pyruvate/2-oxoglutarate dehydrogenase complex dihydrolipoamide acyltransferase (E2) component